MTYKRVRALRAQNYQPGSNLSITRKWHSDESAEGEANADLPAQEPEENEPDTFSREYVQKLRSENAARRTAQRELEARLKAFTDEQEAQENKRLEEQQKWQELAEKRQQELEALQAKQREAELLALRTNIAKDVGLPETIVNRIQGDDEETIRQDAQALYEALGLGDEPEPKQPTPRRSQGNVTTAIPGGEPAAASQDALREWYKNNR